MLRDAPGTLSLPYMRRVGKQGTGVGMSFGTSKSTLVPPNQPWRCGFWGWEWVR